MSIPPAGDTKLTESDRDRMGAYNSLYAATVAPPEVINGQVSSRISFHAF